MQKEILEKQASPDLVVYAVWFNVLAIDDRSRWPEGLLADSRVVELWDGRQVLGRWLAAHPDLRSKGLIGGDLMWDTYLLFGREAVWGESPSHLVSAGHTVVGAGARLQADIVPLLSPAAK